MRVFKTKEFARFARREKIADAMLYEAVARAERGIVDADLTGGLIKQRVARPGRGRSGGFRTLIVFRAKMRSVFVYGFAKSERANIGKKELEFWRTVAAAFLAMDDTQIEAAIAAEELAEVICDDQGEED
jgi:hypothetical protein